MEHIFVWPTQVVVLDLAVCVGDFSMFVNAPTIQELFQAERFFFIYKLALVHMSDTLYFT